MPRNNELERLIAEQTRDRAASRRGPLRKVKPDDESEDEFVEEDDPEEIEIDEENEDG